MPQESRRIDSDGNRIESSAVTEWFEQRKATLLNSVSAHDVLRHFGVSLKFGGSEHEEQIPCPFHDDTRPSARVYPTIGSRNSHLYCYTCRFTKDIFDLWAAFKGNPEMKFSAKIRGLEEEFGITPPEPPSGYGTALNRTQQGPSEEDIEIRDLLVVCERRLRDFKGSFTLRGFLLVGQCLDRLHFRIDNGLINPAEAKKIAQIVLAKIREKVRATAT